MTRARGLPCSFNASRAKFLLIDMRDELKDEDISLHATRALQSAEWLAHWLGNINWEGAGFSKEQAKGMPECVTELVNGMLISACNLATSPAPDKEWEERCEAANIKRLKDMGRTEDE